MNVTLLLISKYPILRTKVRSSCIISHTAIKFCKPNSLPALMIFYSLTWTTPAMFSFSSWKKKKILVLICICIPEKCYILLLAHSFLYSLIAVHYSMHFKNVSWFSSLFVSQICYLYVARTSPAVHTDDCFPPIRCSCHPFKNYATLPDIFSGSSCCFFINHAWFFFSSSSLLYAVRLGFWQFPRFNTIT